MKYRLQPDLLIAGVFFILTVINYAFFSAVLVTSSENQMKSFFRDFVAESPMKMGMILNELIDVKGWLVKSIIIYISLMGNS